MKKFIKIILAIVGAFIGLMILLAIVGYFAGEVEMESTKTTKTKKAELIVEQTHFKYFSEKKIQYRTFTVNIIDTAYLLNYAESEWSNHLTADYYIFQTKGQRDMPLEGAWSQYAIEKAIYELRPALIVIVSPPGDGMVMDTEWFKP